MYRQSRNSGSLNFLDPLGSVQACSGIALPLPSRCISILGNPYIKVIQQFEIKHIQILAVKFTTCVTA